MGELYPDETTRPKIIGPDPGNKCPRGPARLCMNRSQFDNLYGFAEAAGAKLVFGLAMPRSNGGGIWNSTEARALMSYAIGSCKRLFAFELGNEQCGVFTAAETASESHAMRSRAM